MFFCFVIVACCLFVVCMLSYVCVCCLLVSFCFLLVANMVCYFMLVVGMFGCFCHVSPFVVVC